MRINTLLTVKTLFVLLFACAFLTGTCSADENMTDGPPISSDSGNNMQDRQLELQRQMQQQMRQEMQGEIKPDIEEEMQQDNDPILDPLVRQEKIMKQKQREMQLKMMTSRQSGTVDRMSGMPPAIMAMQSGEKVVMPKIEDAVKIALQAADEVAKLLIDSEYHRHGRIIIVPDHHKTIQGAIDSARAGDVVLVKPGIYYEQLLIKNGVKLISDSADRGDELVSVEDAVLQLPRRALRTIIDGSRTTPSKHGMLDFNPGVERKSIIDGFTIQNLPLQNHHIPGHAHGLNVRGASPVVMNCLIRKMGSTGIGSHVVFNDQEDPMPERDFRWQNIKHFASAVLYRNIVRSNVGLGIGCNHFSSPQILGNEVFANSDATLGETPSPGIGIKHGATATAIGNIVHHNPGGGILSKTGQPQGKYHIDRLPYPAIIQNVVYDNGRTRPAIAARGAGTEKNPLRVEGNFIYNSGSIGIGISKNSVAVIEDNMIAKSKEPGIAVNGSLALRLNRNKVTGRDYTPGILIINRGIVHEMVGNSVDANSFGPRYRVGEGSRIGREVAPPLSQGK